MSARTFNMIGLETTKGAALHQLAQASAGCNEFAGLVFSGDAVDGDKFTIGERTFHIKSFNSGSLTLANAALANTKTGRINNVVLSDAHELEVGHIFRVNSEYFKVIRVADETTVDVERGYAGSTVASQASGQNVDLAADYDDIDLVSDVILPVADTLTADTVGPLLVTALNHFRPFGITAEYLAATDTLLLTRAAEGNQLGISAEDVTNADTLYGATKFMGGVEKGEVVSSIVSRVPVTEEVSAGAMHFFFPFAVKSVEVHVITTATRAPVAWDGAISYSADFKRVTLDNSGDVDWATTSTVTVKVSG